MYSQISSNKRRTVIIMLVFLLFVGALAWIFGAYLGNPNDAYVILAIGALYAVIMYYAGSRSALAVNGAQEIKKSDNPRLWRIIENLSLDIMSDTELEGVFAHEMGHVKNYDIRVSMVAFAMVAVVALLADVMLRMGIFGFGGRRNNNEGQAGQLMFLIGIIAAILAPIVATLIQLAVTRQREYLADATGALTTRYPEGLASALEKIEQTGSVLKRQNTATAHFFFANPLKSHSLLNLFSTHPPIEDRIARLRDMEKHA